MFARLALQVLVQKLALALVCCPLPVRLVLEPLPHTEWGRGLHSMACRRVVGVGEPISSGFMSD